MGGRGQALSIHQSQNHSRGARRCLTIVEYTDLARPLNQFPVRVVSPSHSSSCCYGRMKALGKPMVEDLSLYEYRRCPACGFTVRMILRQLPDEAAAMQVRQTFKKHFLENLAEN